MELNDTARVRQPRDGIEHRLATVTNLITQGSAFIQRYQLRFPNGETRMYRYDAVIACTRDDDHAALITAFTTTCRAMRDACRIAHDYDAHLSADTRRLLQLTHSILAARLGVTLDLNTLDAPADTEQVTP